MGIIERKERQRKEVRDRILESAWHLVNEDGWQSLSIRKIADAIEYSVPVIYDHFENKEAILNEFNIRGFKLLGDKLKEAKYRHLTASAQLEAIAYAYWDFAFENREYYQLMYGLGMPSCESLTNVPELMAFIDTIHSTISQLLLESGNERSNSWMKVHSFWSMLHGLVSINLMTPPVSHLGLEPEEMNKMILKDFITGFLKGLAA
jgi:AcrR family transcriptional regulator